MNESKSSLASSSPRASGSPRQSQDSDMSFGPAIVPKKPTSRAPSRQLSRQNSANSLTSSRSNSYSHNSNLPSYMQPKIGHMAGRLRSSRGAKRSMHSHLSISRPSDYKLFQNIFQPPQNDSDSIEAPPAMFRPEREMPYGAMLTSTIKLKGGLHSEGMGRRLRSEKSESLFSPRSHLRGQVITHANAKSFMSSAGSMLGRKSPSQQLPTSQSSFLLPPELSRATSAAQPLRTRSEVCSEAISEAFSEPSSSDNAPYPQQQEKADTTRSRKVQSGRSSRSSQQPFSLTSSRHPPPLAAPPPSALTAIPTKKSSVRAGGFQQSFLSPPSTLTKGPDPMIMLQQLMDNTALEEDLNLMSSGRSRPLELFHKPKSWAQELPPHPTYDIKSLHGRALKSTAGKDRPSSSLPSPSPSKSPFIRDMKERLSTPPQHPSSDINSVYATVRPLSPTVLSARI